MVRKTKIICTIGPASDDPKTLRELIKAGMNVARLNFSHGNHEEQLARVKRIKEAREELNVPLAIMLDTKGPEVRTGVFTGGSAQLAEGSEVRIVEEEIEGDSERFSITYKHLADDAVQGTRLLIDDGLILLEVSKVEGRDVICRVKIGGKVSNHKSINLPDIPLNLPALTLKDKEDLKFAVENELDWIAASFIRRPEDILAMRRVLASYGDRGLKICAKIESREGVKNFSEILKVTDGVMVARGDLGVDIPAEEVPITQKSMIKRAYEAGLPIVTATEMLDSMIRNPRPTRAEVSDVANAIFDGTSCIMLSGETAIGNYPLESVQMMDRIARYTEAQMDYWDIFSTGNYKTLNLTSAISHAACATAKDVAAQGIICVTHSGNTARSLSRFRPKTPVIACTVTERAKNQLSMSWGVCPVVIPVIYDTDELFETAMEAAMSTGLVKYGDTVVLTGGTPAGVSGTTNTIKVEILGGVISRGIALDLGESNQISGDVVILNQHNLPDNIGDFRQYILVAEQTGNEDLPHIREARALVIEDDDPEGHAVTCAHLLQMPIIYGAKNASHLLKNGQMVYLNLEDGTIS